MIEETKGNLLAAEVEALVNPVNTKGVMGKGLALQFKKAFPESFADYYKAYKAGELEVGKVYVSRRLASPKFIVHFPTKAHWRQPSKIQYISDGLADLVTQVRKLGINSIAIPPLGCGNGGLDWNVVESVIREAFADLPEVRVQLYPPQAPPAPSKIVDRRKRPQMTPGRAAVLALMGDYLSTGYDYRLSLVEIQKLAYFLQEAGEGLKLDYAPNHYGPYADSLRKVLRNTEGHYTEGVGDGQNKPETPIRLLPGALEAARAFLEDKSDTRERLKRVSRLIEGFETPFGMELLGTVHWVMKHDATSGELDDIVEAVHSWSDRKHSTMKKGHIEAAWQRLSAMGWGEPSALSNR